MNTRENNVLIEAIKEIMHSPLPINEKKQKALFLLNLIKQYTHQNNHKFKLLKNKVTHNKSEFKKMVLH